MEEPEKKKIGLTKISMGFFKTKASGISAVSTTEAEDKKPVAPVKLALAGAVSNLYLMDDSFAKTMQLS